MTEAYIVDGVRTPIGSFGGSLSEVRPDNVAGLVISRLLERHPAIEPEHVSDVLFGCANQAGEDNRNVARMALLLAGIPKEVPGATVNRLCGSSMEAVGWRREPSNAGRPTCHRGRGREHDAGAVRDGEGATQAFAAARKSSTPPSDGGLSIRDGEQYGVDSMAETAENVAEQFKVSREDQDAFSYRTQQRRARRMRKDFAIARYPVSSPEKSAIRHEVRTDEHPRPDTTLEGSPGSSRWSGRTAR